jgi:G3E family GTPase
MTQHGTEQAPTGSADDRIQVVMVSGFLGAGKTTTLRVIGERLTEQGYTVGMITNDQASGLVDTSILDQTDSTVVEIPGGCFCCNFGQLLSAAHKINTADVDILLAEPVGSCTDLVATVVNPLREMYAAEFSVAPLTAVLDPARVQSYVADDTTPLPEEVEYIFGMQIQEADVLALNKVKYPAHGGAGRPCLVLHC